MRARSLKPGFFKNEILGRADPLIGILYQGLWCSADRDGRLEDRPLRLCAEVFPYRRAVTEKRVQQWLEWLCEQRFIERYEVAGQRYIQILAFGRHQRPHVNEVPSTIPALTSHSAQPLDDQGSPQRNTLEGSKVASTSQNGSKHFALTPDSGLLTPSSLTPDSIKNPSTAGAPLGDLNGNGELHLDMESPPAPDPKAERRAIADRVFEHWKTTHEHPRANADDKRRKLIFHALDLGYTEADLCQAITGYLNSPHHMGENDRNTKYDSMELMLRDSKHIDQGLRFYADPPRTDRSKLMRRNIAATGGWVPPEMRNAGK